MLNREAFMAALQAPDRESELHKFCRQSDLKISSAELIAIAKMVCEGAAVVCPIIQGL